MFQLGAELVHRLNRSLRDSLDSSIGEISNASDDAGLSSRPNREIAKADALNSASDYESPGYRHLPGGTVRPFQGLNLFLDELLKISPLTRCCHYCSGRMVCSDLRFSVNLPAWSAY